MMNLVAISLIATTLMVSGLFSPNPENNGVKEQQVIVKGGHRAVVVEYADDVGDGNTKVSISSPKPNKGPGTGPDDDQLSKAAASVAGVAQDVKGKAHDVITGGPHGARPRELICDAYGKCKHKIAGVWSKAKEKAAEAEEAVEEVVEEVVDKAKDVASKAGRKAEEGVEGVREDAKEKVRKAGEKVRETGEVAREKVGKVKGKTEEMVEETGEKIKEKGRKGKKELSDIAVRGKEVVFDAIWYVFAIGYYVGRETLSTLLSVMQLMGVATAYGIGIWVTFVMSHVLAGVLPRQQFGMVQSKIYPVYFKAMVASIGSGLVGHLLGQRGKMFENKSDMIQGYNLVNCLLLVLGNLLFLEPRATKVMFDRMKLEKEEGRGRVNAPTRVIDTVVGDAAGPMPTTTTTTTTTAGGTTTAPGSTTPAVRTPEDDVAKTKLAKLDDRLKKFNSYSSVLNIMTLMGLTWHLVYLSQRLRATNS